MTYKLLVGNKRYSSWSMRVWVLLKALDIPFEESVHCYVKPPPGQFAFHAISPTGKVPCLHDASSSASLLVHDSLAIVEYVAEDYPRVWPADRAARAWARCAAAEMHSAFGSLKTECSMNVGYRVEMVEPLSDGLRQDLARLVELFEEGLGRFGGPFLAGPAFTAADAFFVPVASRLQTYSLELDSGPAAEYIKRLFAHPAVQAWVEGGLAETEREPTREEGCLKGRKLIQNLCE